MRIDRILKMIALRLLVGKLHPQSRPIFLNSKLLITKLPLATPAYSAFYIELTLESRGSCHKP